MSKIFWNPGLAEHEIMGKAIDRLAEVAAMMANEVREAAPVGTVSRPIYKSGPYKGKWWTARDAGQLSRSTRVVSRMGGRNLWVMIGNTKAYYGKIIEFDRPFFRKAINRCKPKAKIILRGG